MDTTRTEIISYDNEVLTDENRRQGSQSSQSDIELNTNTTLGKSENKSGKNGSTYKTDKLEKYLQDIYQNHCKLSIGESEIEFIRNGVETLVFDFVQRYLPCGDISCKVNHFSKTELLKVGSFYEGTRNGYPDEFDFIAVLGTVDEEPDLKQNCHFRTNTYMHDDIYHSDEFPDASLRFCITDGPKCCGKIKRLSYLYRKCGEEVIIDVDVATAVRCYNVEKYYTRGGIFNEDFYKEILKTGSFLFIYTGFYKMSYKGTFPVTEETPIGPLDKGPWDKTITETEKRFVRDILSTKHRKVYQILKFIVNGHFGEDLFKYLDRVPQFPLITGTCFCISSYNIKVAVIHHHYKCDNNSGEVGGCVLTVLRYFLLTYEQCGRVIFMHSLLYLNEIGSCIVSGAYGFRGNFYWCLRAFIDRLASLKVSNGSEKCTHDLENSFLEMALRLDIFHGYVHYLSLMNDAYFDSMLIFHTMPKYGRLIKKLKHYNEKRNAIPDCSWCDFPIYLLAH